MKIIFLDIDGVLSGNNYLIISGSGLLDFGPHRIDPENVTRLNTLVAKTGAEVVISSSWRILCKLAEMRGWFFERGMDRSVRIISKTPSIHTPNRIRGDEIKQWLDDRRELRNDIEGFVILDDDGDMGDLMPHLVLVNRDTGLTDEDVDRAVEVLNKSP